MKKTKILLPFLTVASTAAIVTPFVTGCSLDWKPAASISHEVFNNGQFIGYTSTVQPAAAQEFKISRSSVVNDYDAIGKALTAEIKNNAIGIMDDIMIDLSASAQDISLYITRQMTSDLEEEGYTINPTQSPTSFKINVATYDAASYKIIWEYSTRADIILYLNFDFKLDLYEKALVRKASATGEEVDHAGHASMTMKCRNVPFIVVPYSDEIPTYNNLLIYFYQEVLAFTSFQMNVDVTLGIDDVYNLSKSAQLTDYLQFGDQENEGIIGLIDWMLANYAPLYHFKNWTIVPGNN